MGRQRPDLDAVAVRRRIKRVAVRVNVIAHESNAGHFETRWGLPGAPQLLLGTVSVGGCPMSIRNIAPTTTMVAPSDSM